MQITEEDIFYFVNYQNSLSSDKIVYIKENFEKFKDMLEFYQSFKTTISQTDENQLLVLIAEKLAKKTKTITLYPTVNISESRDSKLSLAAASTTLFKKTNSMSFADNEQQFLIRVVENEGKRNLFIIPKHSVLANQEMELVLLPSEKKYIVKDLSEPIEIEQIYEIQKIELTISS